MQIWGIVDQDNNVLYGNDDRAAVEAEYERRVAEDPRLRRVLEIAELELAFPGRDEPVEEGEPQTTCVLPWLPLDEPLSFGAVRVDHWSAVREAVEEPARATADALLRSYRNIHNQPVDTPICWFADRSPTAHLAWGDIERMRQHVFFLGLAGIAENAYLHDFEQLNATHCRRVFQFFRSDRVEVSLIRRRREGHWRSPWRASEILSVVPPAAQGRPTAAGRPVAWPLYRQDFLDALGGCVDGEDALSHAIRQSVLPFLRGNEMDEYGNVEQDIVWVVAALEQLFGVARGQQSGRRGARLDLAIGGLFEAWWQAPELRLVRRWASHLYRKRNEIHGAPATANNWHDWAHALLATVVYPLAVKVLLEQADRYQLNGFDLNEIVAFPARIACIEGRGELDQRAVGLQWQVALRDAGIRRTRSLQRGGGTL
jgi:hypothetical protein